MSSCAVGIGGGNGGTRVVLLLLPHLLDHRCRTGSVRRGVDLAEAVVVSHFRHPHGLIVDDMDGGAAAAELANASRRSGGHHIG